MSHDPHSPGPEEQKKTLYTIMFVGALVTIGLMLFQWILYDGPWSHSGDQSSSESSISSASTSLAFPDFQPVVKSGSIVLYQNFVMSVPITPDNIVKYSYRIKGIGKIASGKLVVRASATANGYDPTRIHSVYFYIDDGRTGGHLDATRNGNGQITSGGFTLKESPYNKSFDLDAVPVSSAINQSKNLRVLQTINDEKPHIIGAFVSTGVFGSLDLLQIDYACEKDSECSIQLVR
jgi:hypothetical protein